MGRLASATTASLAVCERAREAGADALLVHHGIYWGSDPRLVGIRLPRVRALLAADCSLLAYHLPLDAHPEFGNARVLLDRLGARDGAGFGGYRGNFVGRSGSLSQPLDAEGLSALLEATLDHRAVHCPGGPEAIVRVAVVTGSGYQFLEEAAASGHHALITGEVSEQSWHEAAEYGIHCFACGHHATECTAVHRLAAHLAAEFGLEHVPIEERNPL